MDYLDTGCSSDIHLSIISPGQAKIDETIRLNLTCGLDQRSGNGYAKGAIAMSLGTILIIILVIYLLGGFSGRFGGYGYGFGHTGIGVGGILLIIVVVLLLTGRI